MCKVGSVAAVLAVPGGQGFRRGWMLKGLIQGLRRLELSQLIVPTLVVAAVVTVVFVLVPVGNPYQYSNVTVNDADAWQYMDVQQVTQQGTLAAQGGGVQPSSAQSQAGYAAGSFVLNGNERVSALVDNYYEALVAGSDERLAKYTDNVEGITADYRRIFAVYVDEVGEIDCYCMSGLLSGTYIVAAVSQLYYKGFDESLPNVDYFYVCTDASGNMYVSNSEPPDDVRAYNEMMYRNTAMSQIVARYVESYDEKLRNNPELSEFVSGFRQDAQPLDDGEPETASD